MEINTEDAKNVPVEIVEKNALEAMKKVGVEMVEKNPTVPTSTPADKLRTNAVEILTLLATKNEVDKELMKALFARSTPTESVENTPAFAFKMFVETVEKFPNAAL